MRRSHFVSKPVTALQGETTIPGDKSLSHRALILGAIANGTTIVSGFLECKDSYATLNALRAMKVPIDVPVAQTVVIRGVGKYGLQKPKTALDCGNSGTSMRLLAGLLAAQPFDSELVGDASLSKRPMARISRPLLQMGGEIRTSEGYPPLSFHGGQSLHGIRYEMPEASAQVKSCLLLAGIYAHGETHIKEPLRTRDHTERMLARFSYPIQSKGHTLIINSSGECLGTNILVPGDISSAAFLIVAATLIPGSEIMLRNVGINPTRTGLLKILLQMGANITLTNERLWGEEPVADILVKYAPLKGVDIPATLVPLAIDEFPIIFIAAACAKGQTLVHGVSELRLKETDRITAMISGLRNLGIRAQTINDSICIHNGALRGGIVDSFADHRITMAFAIAGALAHAPVTIKECAVVDTSFPTFVTTANRIGLAIEEIEDDVTKK